MRYALLGILCGMALGCMESKPPAVSNSPPAQPTTVTANRPSTTERPGTTTTPSDRTNTAVNARDRESTAKTPIDQNENKPDIRITADIRKQVVDTKMSVNAQNVKIITQDGKVTLRGPVNTEAEKQRIEEIATTVAGANKVESHLEVTNE